MAGSKTWHLVIRCASYNKGKVSRLMRHENAHKNSCRVCKNDLLLLIFSMLECKENQYVKIHGLL